MALVPYTNETLYKTIRCNCMSYTMEEELEHYLYPLALDAHGGPHISHQYLYGGQWHEHLLWVPRFTMDILKLLQYSL